MTEPSQPTTRDLPVVPLRETVFFPKSAQPMVTSRERSIRALESLGTDNVIVLATQRDPQVDDACVADLYDVGVTARVMRAERDPQEDHVLVLAIGLDRVHLDAELQREPYLRARVSTLTEIPPPDIDPEFAPLVASVRDLFAQVVVTSPFLPNDLVNVVQRARSPAAVTDVVAASLPSLSTTSRQELLEMLDVRSRVRRVHEEPAQE
jgi:ATP-dependent Lon protease